MTDDFRGAAGGNDPSPTEADQTAPLPVPSDPGPPTASTAPPPNDPTNYASPDPDGHIPAAPVSGSLDPTHHAGPASPDPDGHIAAAPLPGSLDPSDRISATPLSGGPDPYGQISAAPPPGRLDPYGLEVDPWDTRFSPGATARPGPRIIPSPPPDRRRIVLAAVAGLACGLVLFGTGGFLTGRLTADPQPAGPAPAPAATAGLPVFEQSQLALNQPKFPASLAVVAQGWLPYLSGCARSGDSGGPALNDGEKVRVRCTLDGMSAIFVEYDTVADRDKARVKALGQNVDARTLTPGVAAAATQVSPSGRTNGNYVEYAYKLTEGRAVRTVAGVRWDDAGTPVAGYLLAYWTDGLGSSWAPIRDLWARYA